jgi:hypothetical protein
VRALDAFRRVQELEPDHQDVAERVAALERGDLPEAADAPDEPAEAFESFDDLVAEAADDAPAAAPSYESFDDVVAEANDEDEVGEPARSRAAGPALDAETEAAFVEATADDDTAPGSAPGADEPQPQATEPAAPAQRRRRKVSFF